MPRYFFRLEDGVTVLDDVGEELAGDEAARHVAIAVFAETIGAKSDHLNEGGRYGVTVSSEVDGDIYEIVAQARRL